VTRRLIPFRGAQQLVAGRPNARLLPLDGCTCPTPPISTRSRRRSSTTSTGTRGGRPRWEADLLFRGGATMGE
jgi:hypothetical protein